MVRALALIDRIERQIVAHRRRATEAPEMVAAPQEVVPEDVLRDRAECRDSLATFCKRAWHVLEPSQPLRWGWALDAICQHLEAVTAGDIRRLIINVPPGLMKSLGACVFWPSWEWGPKGIPTNRVIGASHEQSLSVRDSTKMRRLVTDPWYQKLWPTNCCAWCASRIYASAWAVRHNKVLKAHLRPNSWPMKFRPWGRWC